MLRVADKITQKFPHIQSFGVGDTIDVAYKIREDEKERIQHFKGLVIALKSQTFTIRRIGAQGIGVERIFPLLSPVITSIEVQKTGRARRAKLYYLRERVGRAAMQVKKKKGA